MHIPVTVGLPDVRWVYLIEPVVGNHFSRRVQDQPPDGIALIGIGIHPPITLLQVTVDGIGNLHAAHASHSRIPVPASLSM